MTVPLESSILKTCMEWLKKIPKCRAVKIHGSQRRQGEPDLYIVINGRFAAVEVKRPGNRPTNLQTAVLKRWADAGAVTGVVSSRKELEELLRRERML